MKNVEHSEMEKRYLDYFNALFEHIIWAKLHQKQWRQLHQAKGKIHTGHIFFISTQKAHFDAMLWNLFRLIDKHPDSASIWKFLNFAESNQFIFSTDEFARRQQGNPRLRRWLGDHIPATHEDVKEDRLKLDKLIETVAALQDWRDTVYGHMDMARLMSRNRSPQLRNFTHIEIEELINTMYEILMRYERAFNMRACRLPKQGERDVQNVVELMREGAEAKQDKLNAKLQEIENEMNQQRSR